VGSGVRFDSGGFWCGLVGFGVLVRAVARSGWFLLLLVGSGALWRFMVRSSAFWWVVMGYGVFWLIRCGLVNSCAFWSFWLVLVCSGAFWCVLVCSYVI
jgi:hypothetical protein